MDIYTIGHSTHTKEEFIDILETYKIEVLVDVRSLPGSNYVPQFNKEEMEKWVVASGIEYIHCIELGGLRKNSIDIDDYLVSGWENKSFRSYAAYSLTQSYEQGIDKLIALAKTKKVCIMCAELVPWRCHRSIISNSLVFKGAKVLHIMSKSKLVEHEISLYGALAIIDGDKLIYPKLN